MSGGIVASASAMTAAIFPSEFANSGYFDRVLLGKSRDRLRRLASILIKRKRPPIGRKRSHANLRGNESEPVLLQLHVAHHAGQNRPRGMRQRRTAKAGMKFISHRRAANLRVALDHQRFVSRLGQIKRRDQPIVTAANDDDVALRPHSYAAPLMSFRISSAARRPFAPMMPPPGCVADPHI